MNSSTKLRKKMWTPLQNVWVFHNKYFFFLVHSGVVFFPLFSFLFSFSFTNNINNNNNNKKKRERRSMAKKGGKKDNGLAVREMSSSVFNFFWAWTAFFWGGVGVCAILFYLNILDFNYSSKIGLYGVSIWLNGWILVFLFYPAKGNRKKFDVYHDAMSVWTISYFLTNLLWEMPWIALSPYVFENLNTLNDVLALSDWMRESPTNMYFWVLSSFSSVDLRTVNHDPTFYTLELYSFVNVSTALLFFYLCRQKSRHRYLIPVLGAGAPASATFIFTFSEVFANYRNMPGSIYDTLLALVWTQYQYLFFPLVFGWLGYELLIADWEVILRNKRD